MAHRVIIKAIKTKIAMDKLARAKINAARERKGLPPLMTWYEHCWLGCADLCREKIVRPYCPCCLLDLRALLKRRLARTLCGRIFQDGTYENDIFKACLGFVGGVVLSYLWFLMLVYQMQFQAMASFFFALGLGVVLSFGLAFSRNVRCLTFLALPSLFSSKGRSALLAFGFLLVLSGPMENFAHNVEVMSSSANCGQELAYNVTMDVVDFAVAPAKAILAEIRETIAELMYFAERLRDAFMKVRNLYLEILAAVRRVFSWLGNMVNICNENMGMPYTKCKNAFDTAIADCRIKLGPMKFMCEIATAISYVCHIARVGEVFCHAVASIQQFVASRVKNKLALAIQNVHDMFYFNVTLIYRYDLQVDQSRSYADAAGDIRREIFSRLSPIHSVLGWGHWVLFALLFWIILKTLLYRHKFLTKDHFDNFYITMYVRHLNQRRQEMKKEEILPLEFREQWQYIFTGSPRLSAKEAVKLALGLVMFFGTFLHAVFYLLLDYGLYWILHTVRVHAEVRTHQPRPGRVKMHVQGSGVLADMYRTMISRLDPGDVLDTDVDTTHCLPNPSQPDYTRYKFIFFIYGVCLFLVVMEAYGLRLRHVITGCYYPQRAKERAVWLTNHILRKRSNFLKLMRRQLRKNAMDQKEEEEAGKISIWAKLGTEIPLLGKILKWCGMKYKYCLACGVVGKPDDMTAFVHCANHGCNGIYCRDCFTDINNLCTVCMNPVDYGDFSDFSEERDSSDDNAQTAQKKVTLKPKDYDYQHKKDLAAPSSDSSEEDDRKRRRASGKKSTKKRELVSMHYFDGLSDTESSSYYSDSDSDDSESRNNNNNVVNSQPQAETVPNYWYDPQSDYDEYNSINPPAQEQGGRQNYWYNPSGYNFYNAQSFS